MRRSARFRGYRDRAIATLLTVKPGVFTVAVVVTVTTVVAAGPAPTGAESPSYPFRIDGVTRVLLSPDSAAPRTASRWRSRGSPCG
jgi:hypothetical protein